MRLRPGGIVATLAQALQLALSEPQGPVHLDLPEDVALAPATETLAPATETVRALPGRIPLATATANSIVRAGELLRAAKRPLAVIGASATRIQEPRHCARWSSATAFPSRRR